MALQSVMAKSALFHLESERLTEPRTAAQEAWVSLLQCTLHAMWPGILDFFPAQASMKAWSQRHSTATSPLAREAPLHGPIHAASPFTAPSRCQAPASAVPASHQSLHAQRHPLPACSAHSDHALHSQHTHAMPQLAPVGAMHRRSPDVYLHGHPV